MRYQEILSFSICTVIASNGVSCRLARNEKWKKKKNRLFLQGKSRFVTTNSSHNKPLGICTNDEKSDVKETILRKWACLGSLGSYFWFFFFMNICFKKNTPKPDTLPIRNTFPNSLNNLKDFMWNLSAGFELRLSIFCTYSMSKEN